MERRRLAERNDPRPPSPHAGLRNPRRFDLRTAAGRETVDSILLNLGVKLMIYGFVGSILTNLIMLIRFVSSPNSSGPAIAEIFHTFFLGSLKKSILEVATG